MSAQLSFVIFSHSEEARAELADRVSETGQADVADSLSDAGQLREAIKSQTPDALLIDLGENPADLLDMIESLPTPRPVLLLVGPEDTQLILRAMRIGAREFFAGQLGDGALKEVVHRLQVERSPETVPRSNAKVLAVMGAKGGVGTTVVASQLASTLQASGARTALVDLNLPLGDVALHFDMRPQYTLADVAGESDVFDSTYLHTILQAHSSGLRILASPEQAEAAELVRPHHVEQALAMLRADFDWVVLDVSRKWDEVSLRALDLADQILLVTVKDVPTLNHAKHALALLDRLGNAGAKIRLIANRYSKHDAVTEKDFTTFLGRGPDARIPNDYEVIAQAVNHGRTVSEMAPKHPVRRAYGELAELTHDWCGLDKPEGSEPNSSSRLRLPFWRRNDGAD